jgi:hypothetical protein
MIIIDGTTPTQEQSQGCVAQVVYSDKTLIFYPDDKEYAAYRFLFLYGYDTSEYFEKLIAHEEFAIEFNIITPDNQEVVEKTLLQKIWHFWFPPDSEKWPEK